MLDHPSLSTLFTELHVPNYPTVTGSHLPITVASVAGFLFACGWGYLVLLACTGWGRFTAGLLKLGTLPAAMRCALGIATLALLGGLLNLAHAISAVSAMSCVAAGLLLFAYWRVKEGSDSGWRGLWRAAGPGARTILALAFLVVLLRAAATVRLAHFDYYDDGQAYLAFPAGMLAHHHFFTGPFSDRHIISSVGAGYWLQALILSATSLSNIGMADRSLGYLLVFFAVLDFALWSRVRPALIAWIVLLACIVPQVTVNLTYVILPIALLLALLWLVERSTESEAGEAARFAVAAGLVAGCTIALKSTFLPSVGCFCLFPFLILHPRRLRGIALPLLAGVAALAVLAPWMLAMKGETGTYLYPILGRGFDYSAHGLFRSFRVPWTARTIVKLFLQAVALSLLALAALGLARGRRIVYAVGVLIAAALGITAFNIATGGDWVWRYGFPQFLAAVIVFAIVAAANWGEGRLALRGRALLSFVMAALVFCFFYYDASGKHPQPFREVRIESPLFWRGLQASLSGRQLASAPILDEYRAISQALPAQSVVLENVAYPFLLNQRAQTIYLADWPGAAGPPPGWPFPSHSEAVAQYLRRHHVRYLLYDYRFAQWVDINSCAVMEHPQAYSTELFVLFWITLLSHNQFDHLRARYRSVYDDGTIAAIDLEQPIANPPALPPLWTIDTDRSAMCSQVLRKYLAGPLPRMASAE
jgi:hypothetical protein